MGVVNEINKASKYFLLIDGDVVAYRASAGCEKLTCWYDDLCFPVASLTDSFAYFEDTISRMCEVFDTEEYVLCFSDTLSNNFRKKLYDSYKSNRSGKPRPIALRFLRNKVINESYLGQGIVQMYPGLEADDVLGILMTDQGFKPDYEKVIISVDKDMKTLPGLFYNITKDAEELDGFPLYKTSESMANLNFLRQALTGDSTDGYPGCPKYGPVTVKKLFDKVLGIDTDGDDDEAIDKMAPEDIVSLLWPEIVKAYDKAGLDEDYALTMARLAYILRSKNWDYSKQAVNLWRP